MTSTQLAAIAPLASPLPPPPEGDALTEDQWKTLYAIGDTVIASITDSASDENHQLAVPVADYDAALQELKSGTSAADSTSATKIYLQESASDLADARDTVHRLLIDYTRKDSRDGLLVLLSALK
jgi:hypothetical protein